MLILLFNVLSFSWHSSSRNEICIIYGLALLAKVKCMIDKYMFFVEFLLKEVHKNFTLPGSIVELCVLRK